jgi:hypothetical protein
MRLILIIFVMKQLNNTTMTIMKTAFNTFVLLILAIGIMSNVPSDKVMSKRKAIRQINEILNSADRHIGAVKDIRKYAKKATCCYSYFVVYAQKAVEVETSTQQFVDLARATSEIKEENPCLLKIASVIGSSKVGYAEFEQLVIMSLQAKSEEERQQVMKKIMTYKE